jgi:hypothetical protein
VAHRYRRPGTYTARVTAADRRGLPSPPATAKVTVRDTRAPIVRIRRARAAADRLVAGGRHQDTAGVSTVQVALTRTSGAGCGQFTGRAVEAQPCSRLTWLPAVLERGRWSYAARGVLLPRGRYVLRARGTDRSGRTSGTDAHKVRLRVR